MELNDFKARMKDGRFVGCYIFSGEEDYLKRYYLGSLRDTVITDDTFATFNHVVYDGTEVDISSLIDHAMSPPMFEPYKMIEWKYPNFDKMKESELNDLEKLVDLAVGIPNSLQARITLTAISPLLAIKTFLNIIFPQKALRL